MSEAQSGVAEGGLSPRTGRSSRSCSIPVPGHADHHCDSPRRSFGAMSQTEEDRLADGRLLVLKVIGKINLRIDRREYDDLKSIVKQIPGDVLVLILNKLSIDRLYQDVPSSLGVVAAVYQKISSDCGDRFPVGILRGDDFIHYLVRYFSELLKFNDQTFSSARSREHIKTIFAICLQNDKRLKERLLLRVKQFARVLEGFAEHTLVEIVSRSASKYCLKLHEALRIEMERATAHYKVALHRFNEVLQRVSHQNIDVAHAGANKEELEERTAEHMRLLTRKTIEDRLFFNQSVLNAVDKGARGQVSVTLLAGKLESRVKHDKEVSQISSKKAAVAVKGVALVVRGLRDSGGRGKGCRGSGEGGCGMRKRLHKLNSGNLIVIDIIKLKVVPLSIKPHTAYDQKYFKTLQVLQIVNHLKKDFGCVHDEDTVIALLERFHSAYGMVYQLLSESENGSYSGGEERSIPPKPRYETISISLTEGSLDGLDDAASDTDVFETVTQLGDDVDLDGISSALSSTDSEGGTSLAPKDRKRSRARKMSKRASVEELVRTRKELEMKEKELQKAQETIQQMNEREQQMKERLADQAQRQLRKGGKFEDLSEADCRPTKLVEAYDNLYTQTRVEALDGVEELEVFDRLEDSTDIKAKLLFSVVVVAFRTVTRALSDKVHRVKKILDIPEERRSQQAEEINEQISAYFRSSASNFNINGIKRDVSSQLWKTLYDFPELQVCMKLQLFIEECVDVAWRLSVQTPPMVIEYESTVFSGKKHTRFYTSDMEADNIKFYVWPALMDKDNETVHYKGVVVT
ncbi:predicted protein [Nematostella vectensis]|uniref:Mitochondria-eating protein n=1 Tax=Nematostella vectensis TaxID=45351 RepID=A7SHD5_NEMVE|nr:predicted protein [Nematostella vectensis]|eukprot:XP_001628959.1 predicted protein [Nematostella vectensis]